MPDLPIFPNTNDGNSVGYTHTSRYAYTDLQERTTQRSAQVLWTSQPPKLTGELDQPCWRQASAYPFMLPQCLAEKTDGSPAPQEAAFVKFLWDQEHLYLGVHLVDHDIMQSDERDQQHHYLTGDVLEIFLKPEEASHYWELYITPTNARTTLFFRTTREHRKKNDSENRPPIHQSAVQVDGSINTPGQPDRCWNVEVAIPLQTLAAEGVAFSPKHPWRMLVSRYNYSTHIEQPELSSFPQLPEADYHLTEQYGTLALQTA